MLRSSINARVPFLVGVGVERGGGGYATPSPPPPGVFCAVHLVGQGQPPHLHVDRGGEGDRRTNGVDPRGTSGDGGLALVAPVTLVGGGGRRAAQRPGRRGHAPQRGGGGGAVPRHVQGPAGRHPKRRPSGSANARGGHSGERTSAQEHGAEKRRPPLLPLGTPSPPHAAGGGGCTTPKRPPWPWQGSL